MILITKTSDQTRQVCMYEASAWPSIGVSSSRPGLASAYVCMYVCMYVLFFKLHITTQSGPVILVILCHSH